jgi:leader peptidase (prepilin peptidase)/N-methyltransferase
METMVVSKAAPDVRARGFFKGLAGSPGREALVIAAVYGLAGSLSALFPPNAVQPVLALSIPLVWIAVTDNRRQRIPDGATFLVTLLALLQVLRTDEPLVSHLALAILVGGMLWAGSEVYWRRNGREALGLGDVKLIAALALWFGPVGIWSVLLIASAGGIAVGLMRLAMHSEERHIPFGPFLSFAALVQAFWPIWGWG